MFFHGFGSDNETNKFTCIKYDLKFCDTVDYAADFKGVFEQYERKVVSLLNEYNSIVLAGHSLGGYFANHFANKYRQNALLINPCLYPSRYMKGRIPDIEHMDLPILTEGAQEVCVLAERGDEVLDLVNDLKVFDGLQNYIVEFFNGGHHRTCRDLEINSKIEYFNLLLDKN